MRRAPFIFLIVAGLIVSCHKEKLPSREQIPILRSRLFSLQEALSQRNRSAMDSLLSADILDLHEDSDSLLRFVYGADGSFPFRELGDYTIFFSNDTAHRLGYHGIEIIAV